MKKTILTILSLAIIFISFSQSDENQVKDQGIVTFEEIVKFNIQLDNMTPEMQEMLPKENRSQKILYFNQYASLYENLEQSDDDAIEQESGSGGVKIMISQPDNIVFRDFKNEKIIEQKEFMTRVFLIESDLKKDEWKISGNQKMILDYPCQEATKQDGDKKASVWFTPAIPISSGPSEFGNLPGLILAVESNDGDNIIIAKSIDLKEIDKKKLKKPKKGKKVSKEKFLLIVEEKNKEMGGESGNSKTVIMKISR